MKNVKENKSEECKQKWEIEIEREIMNEKIFN